MSQKLDLLRKEVDKVQMSQYFGVECDSDDEIEEDESDAEYFSDDQIVRKSIDYDLEKMFEIVKKRDFNNWSMETIHHHYKKVSIGSTGKMQLTRYCFYLYFITIVLHIALMSVFCYSECGIM